MRRPVALLVLATAPLALIAVAGCGSDDPASGATSTTSTTRAAAATLPPQLTCPAKAGPPTMQFSVQNDTRNDLVVTTDSVDCADWSGKWNPSFTNQRPNGAAIRPGKHFTTNLDRTWGGEGRHPNAIWVMHVADAALSPVGAVQVNLKNENVGSQQYQRWEYVTRIAPVGATTFPNRKADPVPVGSVNGTPIEAWSSGSEDGGVWTLHLRDAR